jgi:TolB-like protein/AraC-like DNA-binding protein/Tfp pilus assembly protein PilF
MNLAYSSDTDFIAKITEITLQNLGNENFGVNELAKVAEVNHTYLSQRLHKITNKSVSRFISEVRLEKAAEMLRNEEVTAAEAAYKVGFGSATYFNKCFHDFYGYPPGEVKNRNFGNFEQCNMIPENKTGTDAKGPLYNKPLRRIIFYSAGGFLALFIFYLLFNNLSFETFSILPGNRLKSEDKSIAVIPFKSLSSDEENQYFTEGVTRSILYNLIQISEIKVINNPVEELEGNTLNLIKMAGRLNVRFFLSGSVQKSGEQILVMAQLTDISKNQIVWSEKYPRKLSDIFMIQSEIAQHVATNLQTVIARKEKDQIEKVPTQNMEAHAWCMMGRYLLDRRSYREEDNGKYITPFQNAIAVDPVYAEAYVGLADVYLTITRAQSYPSPEGFIKAKENVLKALELNSNLAEAHTTLGVILYQYEWKWEEARKELELAMELNPNYAQAHGSYANLMGILRQVELSRYHGFKAAELDPIPPYRIISKAGILAGESKFNEAMDEYNKFIEMYPENPSVYWSLWHFYRKTGEVQKAVESLQKAFQLNADDLPFVNTIEVVYDKLGIKGLENWLNEYNIKYDERHCIGIIVNIQSFSQKYNL